MQSDRRTFLKTTATGVASAAALGSTAPLSAQAPPARPGAFEMPRNMTLLNMRTAAGPRLGVKRTKGILDVAAAAARYKRTAPVDMDDLLQNGKGGLLTALVRCRLLHRERLHCAPHAVPHHPVHDRQDVRRVAPLGPHLVTGDLVGDPTACGSNVA